MAFTLTDLFKNPIDTISGLGSSALSYFGSQDLEDIIALGGAAAYQAGLFDPILEEFGLGNFAAGAPMTPPVGYQGGIPEYVAVQQQVPEAMAGTPTPGDRGQRYFTDVIYAQKPDTPTPTLAEARQTATQQGQELAEKNMFAGGLATLPRRNFSEGGYFLGGITDGMADNVPARIDGQQEARLSDGEFVVPADVVSHLGNGNSNAGAQQLYAMMDKVRQDRTGRKAQGKQINPKRYMPGMGA
jgi:hypothetical protein